ncbi:MAG TPA: periplasmic heavy metal sensor [Candidatus Udaeobacter sp.]|nr:periplasmic heavy metal sensor [Candidatus Udaeobacter sp.]
MRQRPPKRRRGKRGSAEPVVLTRKDRVQIAALLIMIVVVLGGFVYMYYHAAKADHDRQFRQRYHLNDDQLRAFKELEKQHHATYKALRNEAEKTRRRVETLFERTKKITPEIQTLFAEANRQREACWTEELEHHRRVSQIMNPEDARIFLTEKEQLYRERKEDRNGFLVLPHN